MSGGSRSLPSRPSLRYLRLEAKRRLAAGEFPALHDAYTAIAREHGLPSWTALKQQICTQAAQAEQAQAEQAQAEQAQAEQAQGGQGVDPGQESHALPQLRWLIARFSGADQPGWTAPVDSEMREHFDDHLLAMVPAGQLAEGIAKLAADLRAELTVISQGPLEADVQLAGMRYTAAVGTDAAHRLLGLRGFPLGERITDTRLKGLTGPAGLSGPPAGLSGPPAGSPAARTPPAPRTLGKVPAGIAEIADDAIAELGLPALVLAGGEPGGPPWVLAKGWADLDRAEVVGIGHRFPAPGVTGLVTATAVLRLVADGRVRLDAPANGQLRAVRLSDDAITVRELLSHTSGVGNPLELYGDTVRDLAALMGPVISCPDPRGEFRPGNGAYAVLGQLIADVTGTPLARAVTGLVLDPLGMRDSRFPARPADIGAGAVTGYAVSADGIFEPFPAMICTVQAVGGLWSTGADLVRLGTGWSSLLPAALAREALTRQTDPQPGGYGAGLGWILLADGDIAIHQGIGLDSASSLHIRVRDNRTHVVLTSRQMTTRSLDERLRDSWTNPQPAER
jgi:CubicO group peptidase (beta-lactamase class C family)